jgi:hypothetical protein
MVIRNQESRVPRTRSYRSGVNLAATVLAGLAFFCGSLACACTIPVFRYALERWESDRFLVIVYHDGQLTAKQESAISDLAKRSSAAGGPLNIEVIRFDVTSPASETATLPDLQPPRDRPLPWVEVRARAAGGRTVSRWEGSLADATGQPGPFESPARKEIVQRLLKGDSCVWLLVAPEAELMGMREQLRAMLDGVRADLVLPKGVGLPGSELYAPIPLEIRFSVLPISHSDPAEQPFLKLLAASAEELRADTAYVIPVFGRCRALEVIPYAESDERLIEDIGNFLCAACSCRVKQANPGFDLLVSVDWNERLFGESIPQSIRPQPQLNAAMESSGPQADLEYLAIPSGNPSPASDAQVALSIPRQWPPRIQALLLLAILTLVGGVLASVFTRR